MLYYFSANLLYWTDISHELLFINPTNGGSTQLTLLDLIKEDNDSLRKILLQANQSDNCANHRAKSFLMNNIGCDIKLMVLWLENMEDFDRLPFRMSFNEFCTFLNQLLCRPTRKSTVQWYRKRVGSRTTVLYCHQSTSKWTLQSGAAFIRWKVSPMFLICFEQFYITLCFTGALQFHRPWSECCSVNTFLQLMSA